MLKSKTDRQIRQEYYFIKNTYELEHRKPVCNAPPHELFLESTNACNLTCGHCIQSSKKRPIARISKGLVEKALNEVKEYMPFVGFNGQGEPMLHNKLHELFRMTNEKGLPNHLVTNGTLLKGKRSVELIESGLDYLIYSIPGGTKQVYEKVKTGAQYEDMLRNLVGFLNLKYEMNKLNLRVRTLYVDMTQDPDYQTEEHYYDKEIYLKMFSKLPIDRVTTVPYFYYFGDEEFEKGKRKKIDNSKEPYLAGFKNCKKPWLFMAVRADGIASACIMDFDSKVVVGDLNKESLLEIWNGDKMQKFRQAILEGDVESVPGMNETCKYCGNPHLNHPLSNMPWGEKFGIEVEGLFGDRDQVAWVRPSDEEMKPKWEYLLNHSEDWIEEMIEL